MSTVFGPLFRGSDANGNQNRQPSDANGGGGGGEEPSSFASMMFSKDAPKIEPRILNLIPLKPDHPPTPPMPHNAAKGTPPRGRILSIDVRLLLQWDQSVQTCQRTAVSIYQWHRTGPTVYFRGER